MVFRSSTRCRCRPARSRLAAAAGLLALLSTMTSVAVATARSVAEDGIQTIPASEAASHVGETAWVCGHVASAAFFASTKGRPTFINLDRPYPDQTFTVVVWESARSRFDAAPERLVDGKSICVRGKIGTYRGKPQIVIDDPEQIRITEPEGGGAELTSTERIFVKSLLSSLGYEANFGSGEWDQQTVEAVIAFQEESGLSPTGEPDPPTLRALAAGVGDIPGDDRDMIIRLLLFELVRRQE